MNDTPKEYLAIFLISAGSSHGRAPTIEEAVENCLEAAREWESLFEIDGKPAKLGIYDVTGLGDLWWDHRVWAEGRDEPVDLLESRDVTLRGKKRRRA